jgi:ribosomal protein S18 acetylase RimI-like enzyme
LFSSLSFVPSELERALAFEKAYFARCAERIIPVRSGQAYFNDSFPHVWWLNFLLADRGHDVDPGELAAEAELLHTDAGHSHRRIEIPDEAVGARVEGFFRRIGWEIERLALMAYRGDGERTADTASVEEVDREALVPLREEIARSQPWATGDEVVREVVSAGEVGARAGNTRFFAVREDGRPVAAAQLNSDGRLAEVDDVATLPSFRGRGYGSAVTMRAVEEALAAGHELVFLVADDDDWPKDLYARLGFETIGRTWSFLRTPALVAKD